MWRAYRKFIDEIEHPGERAVEHHHGFKGGYV
jgi:hypothetical protein